ncbi:hypothetical protein BGX38DRAFT_522729 [Terfezia claveryi]|nr:hypothetical protein BGX38DRAFT_522729 [Terfezia claveryi]
MNSALHHVTSQRTDEAYAVQTQGTSSPASSPLAIGQSSLGFLAEVAIALYEQEAQGKMPPRVASAPSVPSPIEIPAPTKALNRRKRVVPAKNKAQSVASVGVEEIPERPVNRARARAGVQPQTPKASSRRRTLAQASSSQRRIAPGPAPEANPGPSQPLPTSASASDRGKSASKNRNSKSKSKQANSLYPFKRKQMRSFTTIEEMIEQFEIREKRVEDWAKQYKQNGRVIRPEYELWSKEQSEWIMSAAIQYKNDWEEITAGYQKVFPESKPRSKNSIYSKWSRQWEREEKLRQEDPSKTPNWPGFDKMVPPVKRRISEDKMRMIEKAQEIVKIKQNLQKS